MQNGQRKPAEAEPTRLGALAKLPVFFDLQGRKVVVAGGSAGAAWKAELLAAAGARVEIYAVAPDAEMEALVLRGAAAGALALHRRPWSIDVFAGAKLAVADAVDEAEARAFRCAARTAGVPANVIDRPEACDFQFGAIVNRSPVVIGISTDGAAPILGQAIRRRIETLLPPALAHWAGLARNLRAKVMAAFRAGAERRRFWEAFAEHAFREKPERADELVTDLLRSGGGGAMLPRGRVTLVGAGPGDAELLTLKAVRALQSADIILFDDLVSADVLELARREAKRMMVGKRGNRASCRQDDINTTMLALARQGKHVVRLKAGDPMIFGRAGEEIATLQAAGIPVSVVPGITAAQGMAAMLNISLTHRDHAHCLTLMTGCSQEGTVPETTDWGRVVDGRSTAIVYMGARKARALSSRLIADGVNPRTPAVAVASVSRPDAARWSGTLAELSTGVAALPAGAPVIIGLGPVFEPTLASRDRPQPENRAPVVAHTDELIHAFALDDPYRRRADPLPLVSHS